MSSSPGSRAGVRAPVHYSPELGAEICARLARGESQHALAREPGMPSRRTFRDWALRDPEFGAAVEAAKARGRARQIRADREADRERIWRRMLTRAGARGGSVSMLTPELAERICERIAAGETVLAIGADPDMPCAGSIYGWARRDDGFREMYLRAKEAAADLYFDLAHEIAMETSDETVRGDRLRLQHLRWRLALMEPRKYGARRALGPPHDEVGPEPFSIIIRRFEKPDDGPQYVDVEGRPLTPQPDWDD